MIITMINIKTLHLLLFSFYLFIHLNLSPFEKFVPARWITLQRNVPLWNANMFRRLSCAKRNKSYKRITFFFIYLNVHSIILLFFKIHIKLWFTIQFLFVIFYYIFSRSDRIFYWNYTCRKILLFRGNET